MKIPDLCFNKFFMMAVSASFVFSMFLYNIVVVDINDVKADSLTKTEKIDIKLDILNQKTESILISQARIETKINSLTP